MSKLRFRLDRRDVLRSAGLGLAAQLLPDLRNPAYAAETVPLNFLMVYTYHGTWPEGWASGSGTGYSLGANNAALADFKNDLILLKGLRMHSAFNFPPTDNLSGHTQGQIHSTTSAKPNSPIYQGSPAIPGGKSIDQAILDDLKEQNGGKALTDVDSLQLAMMNSSFAPPTQMLGRISYRQSGPGRFTPLAPIQDPNSAWYKAFGGVSSTPAPTPDDGTPTKEDPTRIKRRLMVKFGRGQYNTVANKVGDLYGSKTKERLDAHATFMSELENGLEPIAGGGGGGSTGGGGTLPKPTEACSIPARDDVPKKPNSATGWWEPLEAWQPRIAHMAVACGRTRFVALQIEDSFSPGVHDRMHAGDRGGTAAYHKELARQFARILKMLKDTPTADGKNLLYHSVVLWNGELGDGQRHQFDGLHWMVAGQAGGKWQTGRLLDVSGKSHADLYGSIAKAMGARFGKFGDPGSTAGPLPML